MIAIFFFQAEDSIRDWSVTGVQTSALPILDKNSDSHRTQGGSYVYHTNAHRRVDCAGNAYRIRIAGSCHAQVPRTAAGRQTHRSEERRVGTESRSGKWRDHDIKVDQKRTVR